jgi:hypothetical protein
MLAVKRQGVPTMKNTLSLTAAAIAVFVCSAGVSAGDKYPMTFEELDRDGDGYISAEEAKARPDLAKGLEASDNNKDGQLNSAEFSAFEGKTRLTPPEESEIPEPGAAPY